MQHRLKRSECPHLLPMLSGMSWLPAFRGKQVLKNRLEILWRADSCSWASQTLAKKTWDHRVNGMEMSTQCREEAGSWGAHRGIGGFPLRYIYFFWGGQALNVRGKYTSLKPENLDSISSSTSTNCICVMEAIHVTFLEPLPHHLP